MVEQVIKYSDGTETSIKYRGVIVDGVLQSEKVDDTTAEIIGEPELEISGEEGVANVVSESPAESSKDSE